MNNFILVNLVNEPTNNSGHTLDVAITKNHHSLVKSLTVDTITTLSDHRNAKLLLNFIYAKVERKLIRFRKNNSCYPDNLREELDENFSIIQNDRHHIVFYPCVSCVTTKFKRFTRDAYERCCLSIEKNILFKGECDKWHNTETKISKRIKRHAEKEM